jgi:hypothetical protein
MPSDPRRTAAMAADHVTIGFLQGAGFAAASLIVGIAATIVIRHPIGLLAGIVAAIMLVISAKRRKRRAQLMP